MEKEDFIYGNEDANENNHRQRLVSGMSTSMRVHWRQQFKEAIATG